MSSSMSPTTDVPPSEANATPDLTETRIAASIENWKRNLLDLTKRNRSLNFRVNPVSTVVIVDEQPAEVFRYLCQEGSSMKFKPAPETKTRARELPADTAQESAASPDAGMDNDTQQQLSMFGEDASTSIAAPDYVPYDPASLDERHTDDILQTAATAERLDRSLRRIYEQARLTVEEQGVNTLFLALGMLRYTEAAASQEVFKAPLVLVPVELSRKSARTGYVVKATDDDPLVNPALVEYLRRNFSLGLPELPDSDSLDENYDLQDFLRATTDAISSQPGWSVTTEIYLGLFSFQKFVMYTDLEANTTQIQKHRLVRQLITRSGSQVIGLPDEVHTLDLDNDFPPERTFQVVDADSSQIRCIAAAARNYDLVIEGPPGTGKSQTITNLIAQALSKHKTVLFVAEKMAALQVVHRRLVRAGLGEFCLELHSTKANKRAVMQELRVSLDASLQKPAVPGSLAAPRLPGVRQTLTEYVRAVHAPHGALGISPYRAYGELGAVINAPKLKYNGPTDTVTREQLDRTIQELNDLAMAASDIGNPAAHPWRDAAKTFYAEADLDAIGELGHDLVARLETIRHQADEVSAMLSLPTIQQFNDIETAALIAAVIARSPGAPLAVLDSEAWNAPPPAATAILERGRKMEWLKEQIGQRFTADVLTGEHAADISYVEQKARGLSTLLTILDSRHRAIRRQWLAFRLPGYRGSMAMQARDMSLVVQLHQVQQEMAAADSEARQLFGALWQGEATDWNALEAYIQWVVEFRAVCVRHSLTGQALEVASRRAPDVSNVNVLRDAGKEALRVLAELRRAVGWPDNYLDGAPIDEVAERVRALVDHLGLAQRWAAFESARSTVAQGMAVELLPPAMAGQVTLQDLAPAFLRAFYQKWLSGVVQARPPLWAFHSPMHDQRVVEFRQLDERVLQENQIALVAGLRDRIQKQLRGEETTAAMPFLRREMARQRGLSPLRRTIKHAEAAIRAIKPCFMMSPLTVAQLLSGSNPIFDVVIFDEASQLPPEDAVGAIIRGKQLIVVGDPKQLPPTNFFSVVSGQVTAPVGDDGLPLYEDSESVLEDFMGSGAPTNRLKWHYRSLHESLIAFSNASFYDADLHTFPSVETDSDATGVKFEFVEGGVYEGKGLNMAEARRVADAVVQHAKTHPELSLGVGTFNLRQQIAIQDELEVRRRQDPRLEPFFAQKEVEPFFVKNLENIQGDERDVIFISVTYAKGVDGRLHYNFGPLNMQNGWRRLNVLVTRARKHMRVFSSIHAEDISATTTSAGARLLQAFLLYAEHGRLDHPAVSHAAETESPLERDVYTELTRRGISVVPQVGVSGYRIDLGVLDDTVPGRYVCGIECDGVAYHASETARDRDRLRQQVLEERGWTIHRVWSTDWFKDRLGQIERLLSLIAASRESARQEAEAEKEAHGRAEQEQIWERSAPAVSLPAPTVADAKDTYERPVVPAYRVTPGEGRWAGRDILREPASQIQRTILNVVNVEAPLHVDVLISRVADIWGWHVDTRISKRILEVCKAAEREHLLIFRGKFVWKPDGAYAVRSRSGMRIPPERIAPEEYREAILLILRTGYGFARPQLIGEVRAVLGFGRITKPLQRAVEQQIERLLNEGAVGEGSAGITLRR